jgi:hypothetical protein
MVQVLRSGSAVASTDREADRRNGRIDRRGAKTPVVHRLRHILKIIIPQRAPHARACRTKTLTQTVILQPFNTLDENNPKRENAGITNREVMMLSTEVKPV